MTIGQKVFQMIQILTFITVIARKKKTCTVSIKDGRGAAANYFKKLAEKETNNSELSQKYKLISDIFNKEKTKLICYARMRPEEEYTVPSTVKQLKKYSFFYPKHLKKLYIHKSTQIEDNALTFYDDNKPEIIYI